MWPRGLLEAERCKKGDVMDSNEQQLVNVKLGEILIHPFAQPAYECDFDLRRQCVSRPSVFSSPSSLPFEYPKAIRIDGYYQVISAWSQLLSQDTHLPNTLKVISIAKVDHSCISSIAWQYLITRLLNQVDHATYCAQLSQVFKQSSLSHSDIEALTGVSAKTPFAIARKLSQTSLSTSKRQMSRLAQDTDEGAWL
tara:strand:+ start:10994 stop:11581 length:588 start_codon:yes stop_codon:yes gene_type:complete